MFFLRSELIESGWSVRVDVRGDACQAVPNEQVNQETVDYSVGYRRGWLLSLLLDRVNKGH